MDLKRLCLAGLATGLGAALVPDAAHAHLVGVEFGDFYAGALHLTLALEHIAALVLLGLVGAQQPRETARWMLLALPVGLALGCALAMAAPGQDPTLAVALSLAVAGLAGIVARHMPLMVLGAGTAVIAAIHGYANGVSAAGEAVDLWLYTAGIATAGTLLGTLAIGAFTALIGVRPWLHLGTRVLSSWLATLGLLLAGLSLAQ